MDRFYNTQTNYCNITQFLRFLCTISCWGIPSSRKSGDG